MSELYNDADYIELVIKCLFRDRQTLNKALDLQVTPEDFGTIAVYNVFVATALQLKEAPINSNLCLATLKTLKKNYNLSPSDNQTILEFWEYLYNDEAINAEYIRSNLADFVKFRRFQALKVDKAQKPEELLQEASKLVANINLKNGADNIREFNPFDSLVTIEIRESLGTGFETIDLKAKGLNYQEFGLILGHSGSGKTAMAIFSALQNAKKFRKVLYLSLEEPAENICNRVYSNIFRIPYTDLHKGSPFAKQDLEAAFAAMSEVDRTALKNLQIVDMRDVTPLTAKYIQTYLDKKYDETGYHPDLVYIDQMDYLSTNDQYDADWQKYNKVSFEVDDLSNHLIGGRHPFSVWLLHQAGGKMSKQYTNADITGFKGILKPVDMALAIGRDSAQKDQVSIFSLKSRHAKNFQYDYYAELEYMNFEPHDKTATARVETENKEIKEKRSGNFTNVPAKPDLLPSAHSGFKSTV
jgi:replicative DNA helicase